MMDKDSLSLMKRSLADLESALTDARAAIEKAQDKAGKLETAIARHPDYLARKMRLALPPYMHERFLGGMDARGRLLDLKITEEQVKLIFEKEVVAFYAGSHPGINYGPEKARDVDETAFDHLMALNNDEDCVALVVLVHRAHDRIFAWEDGMLGAVYNLDKVRTTLLTGEDVSLGELQQALRTAFPSAPGILADLGVLELAREKKALPSQQEIHLLQRPVKKRRMD